MENPFISKCILSNGKSVPVLFQLGNDAVCRPVFCEANDEVIADMEYKEAENEKYKLTLTFPPVIPTTQY